MKYTTLRQGGQKLVFDRGGCGEFFTGAKNGRTHSKPRYIVVRASWHEHCTSAFFFILMLNNGHCFQINDTG